MNSLLGAIGFLYLNRERKEKKKKRSSSPPPPHPLSCQQQKKGGSGGGVKGRLLCRGSKCSMRYLIFYHVRCSWSVFSRQWSRRQKWINLLPQASPVSSTQLMLALERAGNLSSDFSWKDEQNGTVSNSADEPKLEPLPISEASVLYRWGSRVWIDRVWHLMKSLCV